MVTFWELAVCVVLAVWWTASAVAQHKRSRILLLSWWDNCWISPLLPVFTFFAPRPASRDLYLLIRSWNDGEAGPWREVEVGSSWRWFHCVWNPGKRQGKALSDIVNNLLADPPKSDVQFVLHNSYLQLLCLASSFHEGASSTHLQFLVIGAGGYNSGAAPAVTLLSNLHRTNAKRETRDDNRVRA
ncbi:hypothetical protein ACIOMM_20120 [Streptomyces sp. NPDC087908]|uniref:hypothetical protein n=1 Tax=unclassified Streptomyces TaxID=2593676 RepID=UPI0011CDB7D4|nr:hypothetical protein [Streptomyces sp. adm13(2018)]